MYIYMNRIKLRMVKRAKTCEITQQRRYHTLIYETSNPGH